MLVWLLEIIRWLIDTYLAILVVRMVIDWILVLARRWRPRGLVADIIRIIYELTEPPLAWLRRWIPSIPLGPVQLDVSFLVLYFVLGLVAAFI
ncbi:MAG: YggT family protein [Bifidobacteriaceae bacterium]|nr:YggT family protein [Aeriscardovia sp.]MEE1324066.1 YggT family protein [Bifidobacteriaceae bacterium]